MISFIALMEADTQYDRPERASYLIAGLTGIGGPFTGGPLYSIYSKRKEQAANTSAGLLRGEKDAILKHDNSGGNIISTYLAGIPGLGALVNMNNAYARNQAIDQLHAEMKKKS